MTSAESTHARLLDRYRQWREDSDQSGDGPVIWWPTGWLRVFFHHELWAFPLAIAWDDQGDSNLDGKNRYRPRYLTFTVLCFDFMVDLTIYPKGFWSRA